MRPLGRLSAPTLALIAACALSACGEDRARAPAEREGAGARAAASAAGEDEEDLGATEAPTSAWPDDVRDLRATLDAFESLDACRRAMRARLPTEIAEAIADIGYDQLVDDVCAGVAAVKAADVAACDALSVSVLRRGCRRRLALVHARPDACGADAVMPGRDPVCLAWASRDPGLCRAAALQDRATCAAVLAGDADRCPRTPAGDRARCVAEVERYASSLGEERARSAAADVEPVMRLEATVVPRTGAPTGPIAIDRDVLERGVHLEADGCAWRVRLASPLGELPTPVALPDRPPTATISYSVRSDATAPIRIPFGATGAAIEVVLPGITSASAVAGANGELTVTEWAPARGALLAATIDADLDAGTSRVRVRGEARTFVRDVDPLPDRCPRATRGQ